MLSGPALARGAGKLPGAAEQFHFEIALIPGGFRQGQLHADAQADLGGHGHDLAAMEFRGLLHEGESQADARPGGLVYPVERVKNVVPLRLDHTI